jgi:hypothetical protein
MSLDLFRGATIAGMILVNNAGDEPNSYWPLKHAAWNGWTPTDLVFPFFLFIVGVAMVFSFSSRLKRGESRHKPGVVASETLRSLGGVDRCRVPVGDRTIPGHLSFAFWDSGKAWPPLASRPRSNH